MMHGLYYSETDPNYSMLIKLFKIIDSRRIQQIIARNGIKPIERFTTTIKLIFLSNYFNLKPNYLVNQLKNNKKLLKKFNIKKLLSPAQITETLSRFEPEQVQKTINAILKKQSSFDRLNHHTYIVDATAMDVDYNTKSRKISKKQLENKDPKWAYGTSIGHYVGYKVTLVLEYHSMIPVAIILNNGSPNDSKKYNEILEYS